MRKMFFGCSLAISMFLLSCQTNKKAAVTIAQIDQTSWKLVSLDQKSNPAFEEGDLYTISFSAADSAVSGVGACNRFFGKLALAKDDHIDIKMGGATMMACPNLDLESSFFKTLDEMSEMKMENDSLILLKDDKEIAKFIPFMAINDDGHHASNSLDYWGTYKGTFPAADCPGINVTLTLNQDSTYTCSMEYIDRNTVDNENGTYLVDKNTLILISKQDTSYYQVGENRLMRLDDQKQPITGEMASHYELNKEVK